MLERAHEIDRRKAVAWAYTVISREATRLARQRGGVISLDEADESFARTRADSHGADRDIESIDIARRAQEVLQTLPETQAQAVCLRAQGLSYDEIADTLGWSPRKTKRAVIDGNRAFTSRYEAVAAGLICDTAASDITAYLDGTLSLRGRTQLRAHLTRCPGCRAALHGARGDLALQALLPPAIGVAASQAGGRRGWLTDQLLTPIDNLLTRSGGAVEHLTSAKLGAVAASAVAVAGGSVVAGTEIERRTAKPVPTMQTALTVTAPVNPPSPQAPAANPAGARISDAIAAALQREASKERAAAKERAARAERRRQARRQQLAAAREFTPGTAEFAPPASSGGSAASRSSPTPSSGGSPANTASAPTAPQEVTVGGGDEPSIDVTTEGSP